MTRDGLLAILEPVMRAIAGLGAAGMGPASPASAVAALASLDLGPTEAALREAFAEGWLTPRSGGGVRFGRLSKPGPDSFGLSVDVVDMAGPASGAHTHLSGEFDLCFALEGRPRFDGHAGPWVVYPPGSRHVPTVTGGRMLIAYFVPDGALRFDAS